MRIWMRMAGVAADPLKDLMVRRLLVLQDRAETAGATGYGRRDLGNQIGRRPASEWLRAALAEANGAAVGTEAAPKTPGDNATGSSQLLDSLPKGRRPCQIEAVATGGGSVSIGDCPPHAIPPPRDRYATDWERLKPLAYYRLLEGRPFASSAKPKLLAAEKASGGIFHTFAYWDALLLNQAPPTVGDSPTWLAQTLWRAPPEKLSGLADTLVTTAQSTPLPGADETRQFILRHAIARRALELGCSKLAIRKLELIQTAFFSDGKVPGAFADVHDRVVGVAHTLADSGACIQAPAAAAAVPDPPAATAEQQKPETR